tara:strand:- start:2953 stop:3255 length:303 start_codon:yes stop_codon:yes gene_type:complete
MTNSPAVVNYFIPLMKSLNMSWAELKATPAVELEGLVIALSEYNILHSFDGYTAKEIGEMAKNKPQIRTQYNDYIKRRRKYGIDKAETNFSVLGNIKKID